MGEYDAQQGRRERRATTATAVASVLYVAGLGAMVAPEIGAVAGAIAAAGAATAFARNKWTPLRGLAEARLVRSLRKGAAIEGVVVPLRMVESQEGPCCAFDHVVHRCQVCACTRPCSVAGGRYRAEDRGTGRFLVKGEQALLLVDGTDVRFASSLTARMTSHFHRLDGGRRVRAHGDLVEATEIDDDVRALTATMRDVPRVLVPREGSAVAVELLD